MAVYYQDQSEQQLTNLAQNPILQPGCWPASRPQLYRSRKSELSPINLGCNSTSLTSSRMATLEFPWSLSVASNTTLSSLSASPNIPSSVFPLRDFPLEQLTSMDNIRYLRLGEPFAFYTHLS
uniref:Uncharacterized protein n=1 Tax=Setaria digitata TaxID=48799 RepID=A0A915Q4T2_9BILA